MLTERTNNRLVLENLHNARDLGGLRSEIGGCTAYHRFIRSDDPSYLNECDLDELIRYPVGTVIDLRSEEEIARHATPFMNVPSVLYRNISLFESDPDQADDATVQIAIDGCLGTLYIHLLETRQIQFSQIFREMLAAPDGAILFHCTHGKDRTGIIAALLLLLVRVSRRDIIENYSVTYDYIKPLVDPKITALPFHMRHILKSDAENMELLLDYLDDSYDGRAEYYLEEIGLSEYEIHNLKRRILGLD